MILVYTFIFGFLAGFAVAAVVLLCDHYHPDRTH